jgi:hypothetical protein
MQVTEPSSRRRQINHVFIVVFFRAVSCCSADRGHVVHHPFSSSALDVPPTSGGGVSSGTFSYSRVRGSLLYSKMKCSAISGRCRGEWAGCGRGFPKPAPMIVRSQIAVSICAQTSAAQVGESSNCAA